MLRNSVEFKTEFLRFKTALLDDFLWEKKCCKEVLIAYLYFILLNVKIKVNIFCNLPQKFA